MIRPSGRDLKRYSANVTSQSGEDGIIEEIFRRIGIANRWCFECGASDGVLYSNMQQWIRQGWHAVLVETDDARYEKLSLLDGGRVRTIHAEVRPKGVTSIDALLDSCFAPKDIDLVVIDVDGQDLELFDSVRTYTPRVFMVEFASDSFGKTGIQERRPPYRQACITAVTRMGESKGYEVVATTDVNLIFVRNDLVSLLDGDGE